MKYTLKKRLFAKVLLNEKGQKLNLKNTPFTLKNENGNFSLLVNKEVVSPKLTSIEHSNDITLGTTPNFERCQINLETGKVSKTYIRQVGKYYVLPNGEFVTFNKNLQPVSSNFTAVVNYGNRIKYPGNTYNKIVVKHKKTNKYGVMDENGKIICPCIFDTPGIWFNFEVVKQLPEGITNPLQLHIVEKLSCYSTSKGSKVFNGQHQVIFETTPNQVVMKLEENKKEVSMAVYDRDSNYTRIYTYNFKTKQFVGKALIKGVAVKYEKIKGDVYYGATRLTNNKLMLVDFVGKPITNEQFNTVEFINLKDKTVAVVSKNNKYGIFDIRNRQYIVEPTKTYTEVMNQVKNGKEEIK